MNIAHTDLKPGDRFRLTETDGGYVSGLAVTTIFEGTVTSVDADKVFYGPNDYGYLTDNENATWERIAPAEPKNLGAVVEFTNSHGETITVVRAGLLFKNDSYALTWESIIGADANPRVLHEGWDGK